MPEWEYRKIALNEFPRGRDDVDLLCDAGLDGWELVVILPINVAYLKREVVVTGPGDTTAGHGGNMEPRSEVKPKYRDPKTGETWSGRGRMAAWLKRKQDAGEDIDDYLV
jgi:hypothetical protein